MLFIFEAMTHNADLCMSYGSNVILFIFFELPVDGFSRLYRYKIHVHVLTLCHHSTMPGQLLKYELLYRICNTECLVDRSM